MSVEEADICNRAIVSLADADRVQLHGLDRPRLAG
jgi:hypothetical protein